MRFSLEISAWAGFGLIAWILGRSHFWRGCVLAGLAAFAAVPLLRLTADPEGSEWAANFLSSQRIGFAFGSVGGVITGGAIAALFCLPKDRNRRRAICVFVITGLFVALSPRKSEILTPYEPSGEDVWKDGVCIQTTDSSCGPASLATCFRALGVPGKEDDLAAEANTSADGTLIADLGRVARSHGLSAAFHAHEQASSVPLPAVASVTLPGKIDHFVALVERNGQRFIADPLNGLHPMASAKYYEWSGMFLSVNR